MHINRAILEKYFQGDCSEQERLLVEAYLEQTATPELDALLTDTWHVANKPEKKVHRLWWTAAAAAVVAGLIVLAGQNVQHKSAIAATLDTIYNNTNRMQVYNLSDGSQVWLNAHSRLGYSSDYNIHGRDLWLEGEALFKVVSNAKQPFNVHTRFLTTRVLGTTFHISTVSRADSSIQISLLEGKIAVSGTNGYTKVLMPGEMLTSKGEQDPPTTGFDAKEILDWKENRIVFNRTTLADVLIRLQQREGCKITLTDNKLAAKRISGDFSANTPIGEILATLAYVHELKCIRAKDGTYLISSKK
ncbi:FecR family protein [Chitinophaga jiangningensis]|uniref:FecR family protein n=1 Tax=Chitinophaga jiangningensis TaxID=1419482 RepID=A0A1M7DPT2_9BACT|nr:FecR domain-containing protein [Chitinophaga jiangningensis]SHL81179.1 FecR family protein [Chitinophaga jiangningensis]